MDVPVANPPPGPSAADQTEPLLKPAPFHTAQQLLTGFSLPLTVAEASLPPEPLINSAIPIVVDSPSVISLRRTPTRRGC